VKDGRKAESSVVTIELIRHVYLNFIVAPTVTYSASLRQESLASSNAKQSAEAKHKQMEFELSELSVGLFSIANETVAMLGPENIS
jgi:hypothetical protein